MMNGNMGTGAADQPRKVRDVYSLEQMKELVIDTSEYKLNLEVGVFCGTLEMKAEARSRRTLRLFFTFDDGRKVFAPVFQYNRFLGFYEIPVGSRVKLTYRASGENGVWLLEAKRLEEEPPLWQ